MKPGEIIPVDDPAAVLVASPPNGLGALAAKFVTVMAKIDTVPKRGHNDFHNYDYATEADVADAVRRAMVEARIAMIPSLVEIREREITTRQQKQEIVTTVIMRYLVIDADTGASLDFQMPGSGQDPGDKGLMKALTAASKYAALKAFQISTGDDPEADDDIRVEREPGADEGAEDERQWADDELPPDTTPEPGPTAPARTDCISEGKVKRVYALMGEAAKRTRESPAAVKERTVEKIKKELHVDKIEHIPWKGNAYQRVCDWIENLGRR